MLNQLELRKYSFTFARGRKPRECGGGNHGDLRGLPGGAEGIRNDGHVAISSSKTMVSEVPTVFGRLEAKPANG
jgi:hypothetical protein